MAALNFPANPTNGQTYENYVYDGTDGVWKRISNPTGSLENLDDVDLTTPAIGDSLVYDGTDWVNGPRSNNAIINGDFGVWQRGTSFTGRTVSPFYSADRFRHTISGATVSVTRESFTPAEIQTIGYGDAEYYLKLDVTVADDFSSTAQFIEDVRTFAGQTVTFSFWAKSDSARTLRAVFVQNFGSGGSGVVAITENISVTTSWQRFTVTKTLGSMSGKTIGAGSFLEVRIDNATNETWELSTWGWQLEAGSVATPFRLAGGGSKAAELALCERYYQVIGKFSALEALTMGQAINTNIVIGAVNFPEMRITPSLSAAGTFSVGVAGGARVDAGGTAFALASPKTFRLTLSSIVGSPMAANNASLIYAESTDAQLTLDAEL